MKKTLTIFSILIIAACSNSKTEDKKAELEDLIKQKAEISEKIKTLEEELGKGKDADKFKLKDVTVSELHKQEFVQFTEIQGRVDADQNISIGAKTAGVVTQILVNPGDQVRTGQLLARLDDQLTQQGIEEVKTGLEFARSMFAKQENLWKQKIGTEMQYLQSKNTKESLERKLATLEQQADMSKIKSPINGTIDEVSLKLGQNVAPGMPTIRVVNLSDLKAKAEVAESYISKIHQGNDALVYFPDLQKEIKTKVSFAARTVNPLTRTFSVEAKLQDSPDFRPNMVVVLKIANYSNKDAMVIPVNTIQSTEEGDYVLLAAKTKDQVIVNKQKITVGNKYGGKAEVKSGLKQGDLLITTGYQDLNPGDRVKL